VARVLIVEPRTDAFVGRNIEVSGRVQVPPADGDVSVGGVWVRLGQNEAFDLATQVGSNWASWRYRGRLGGGTNGPLEITVRAEVTEVIGGEPGDPVEIFATVMVVADTRAPAVWVNSLLEVTTTTVPFRLNVKGEARDEGAGLQELMFQLDEEPFVSMDSVSSGWEWTKTIDLQHGDYVITVQATDNVGNRSLTPFQVYIRPPFLPPNADLAFASITYLQELIAFAGSWIKVGGTDAGPTAQHLAARFFQPFDRLTRLSNYEEATRPVPQPRIAVEVLRALLRATNRPVPGQVERRFHGARYMKLLLQAGTSHEELRTARLADDNTRQDLAERLGLSLESTRPDRLDRITFMPDDVTEGQLERLFGFERTTQADPLEPHNSTAQVLNWRLAAMRNRWLLEDAETSDGAAEPLPILDPDVVDRSNLRRARAGDRVYDLWKARKDWLDEKFAEAESQRPQGLSHVIRSFIGDLDFAALERQDADGVDITPTLNPLHLDLPAFRFLAKCRRLDAAGALLATEWHDVVNIVVEVEKKRQYQQWREEEAGLAITPQFFRLSEVGDSSETPTMVWPWRAPWPVYDHWHKTLTLRIRQEQEAKDAYKSALAAGEAQALPVLRDALVELIGRQQTPPENVDLAAERLSRELMIDLRTNGEQTTTRVNQAIDTLLAAVFSVRAGHLPADSSGDDWRIAVESDFDPEWQWMAAYRTWRAAMTVFAYPESQLDPHLFVKAETFLNPTAAFLSMIASLREVVRMTPRLARDKATEYLTALRAELGNSLPPEMREDDFSITDQLDLFDRKQFVAGLPNPGATHMREAFWLVPVAIALQLQKAGHYLTALDWYQTVYAFNLPRENRKIYPGLELEESTVSDYGRLDWLRKELNPHIFARRRNNAYTRFTVLSIARCFLEFADSEFSQNTTESIARARTLYQTAEDLLALPDVQPEVGPQIPFPPNPIWGSLRVHAQANLSKIHQGMNIAGVPAAASGSGAIFRPSQYRYSVLIERTKQLVGIAQQVESAFLMAIERRDAEAYNLIQAGYDLRVAGARVTLQDLRIADADLAVRMAHLQQERAQIQLNYFRNQIEAGKSAYEHAALAAMASAIGLQTGAAIAYSATAVLNVLSPLGLLGGASSLGQALSALSQGASLTAGLFQAKASFERREQEWQLQMSLSGRDIEIGRQQILLASNQRQIAVLERELAGIQLAHAEAIVDFLVNKFTNTELYEWMSGVLSNVYSFFLQQATAMAQLAEAQLAFERQEPPLSVIRSDYWQVIAEDSSAEDTDGTTPDRRGLTGSARLLQDVYRLDQYAFETQRRKLQLTQTISLAQIAPIEFQTFRETGRLIFATPMELFDRDFPGHYLRLVRRVRMSIAALVPATRGVRATLAASGISRVVTGGETFEAIEIHRPPESVAFTSPMNATGLFELDPDAEMLLPFEGMGVETFWELQLPKAANPFDYRTIPDVLLTIDYTALSSPLYRDQVIRRLGRTASGDRIFSFRQQFADAWYELNNADAIDPQRRMVARFSTRVEDFPPHIQTARIQHLSFLVARKDGFTDEMTIPALRFTPNGETASVGGSASTVAGVVSTRRPNGSAWLPMIGKLSAGDWELRLPNTNQVKGWFKDGAIEDLGVVITFEGTTPAWPV
jgi:Tc toxin complex TcA C-terminal TcB-binding domain